MESEELSKQPAFLAFYVSQLSDAVKKTQDFQFGIEWPSESLKQISERPILKIGAGTCKHLWVWKSLKVIKNSSFDCLGPWKLRYNEQKPKLLCWMSFRKSEALLLVKALMKEVNPLIVKEVEFESRKKSMLMSTLGFFGISGLHWIDQNLTFSCQLLICRQKLLFEASNEEIKTIAWWKMSFKIEKKTSNRTFVYFSVSEKSDPIKKVQVYALNTLL